MPASGVHNLLFAACLMASVAACSSSDSRAQNALAQYHAAAAEADLPRAQRALLQLVRAKEDVSDYWIELAKVQVSMGSFSDAYHSYTRAYELDRSNPALLRAVTELALRTGDFATAEKRAGELEVVAPGDPWVKITYGWGALSRSQFTDALATSESLLQATPHEPTGTVLKARALLGLKRGPEAVELLETQVQTQPTDIGSLDLLSGIYRRRGEWAKAADTAERISKLSPENQGNWLVLIEAALRAGDVAEARRASAQVLQPNADPTLIRSVLTLWRDHWNSPQRVQDARALAAGAGPQQKLVYAAFLSRAGDPATAARLSAPAATLPVEATNSEANAVLADASMRMGRAGEARRRFDAVIAFDPGNATALRGRAELHLKTGNAAAAVSDAQKLVSVLPTSADDRLLLARCFAAGGKTDWVDRTLWAALQDIPANDKIHAALAARKKGDQVATRQLENEFARQLDARLRRSVL